MLGSLPETRGECGEGARRPGSHSTAGAGQGPSATWHCLASTCSWYHGPPHPTWSKSHLLSWAGPGALMSPPAQGLIPARLLPWGVCSRRKKGSNKGRAALKSPAWTPARPLPRCTALYTSCTLGAEDEDQSFWSTGLLTLPCPSASLSWVWSLGGGTSLGPGSNLTG